MDITIKDYQLKNLIAGAVDMGIHAFYLGFDPGVDRISMARAEAFLKVYGYQPSDLRKWTRLGLLHPEKKGGHNSKVAYSWLELKKVLFELRFKAELIGNGGNDERTEAR